jgi:hypothetical protein
VRVELPCVAVDIVGVRNETRAVALGTPLFEINLVLVRSPVTRIADQEPAIEVETVDRLDW